MFVSGNTVAASHINCFEKVIEDSNLDWLELGKEFSFNMFGPSVGRIFS